ncbi:MAG: Rrf2 family transcriptional regulator [Lentisphaerae bacterium GWF2_52_8]|nr:MAG: Rrf2 family transcriptional regulator [Lentisphaerae bacterium GWF2_52_8]
MKLTVRSEYALLALVHLARQTQDGYVTIEKIASKQGIPPKFLEQLMLILKRAKYVRSLKGHGGGYRLGKAPEEISIAEIIRLFDGALAPTESVSKYFYESTPIEKERRLVKLFREIRDQISNKLENTTIAEMIR